MGVEGSSRTYEVKWADLDPVGHLRLSVYIDYAIDTQVRFVAEHGYPQAKSVELGFGPAVLRLETRYYSEVTLGESVTDSIKLAGMSPDGARWKIRHDIVKSDGEKAATVKVEGTWLDLRTRQAIAPPSDLRQLLDLLPRTANFEELRSFVRK